MRYIMYIRKKIFDLKVDCTQNPLFVDHLNRVDHLFVFTIFKI